MANRKPYRPSSGKLIQNLKRELWAGAINFFHFALTWSLNTKPQKCDFLFESAVFYAARAAQKGQTPDRGVIYTAVAL